MHVHYKFGLFLIFILSVSIHMSKAAQETKVPSISAKVDDIYDDYNYDDDSEEVQATTTTAKTTTTVKTTTKKPIVQHKKTPLRSNHVLEPSCPMACVCLDDFQQVNCANARLTRVPHDLPHTALSIDLSWNSIATLEADDFLNCSNLREINLSYNSLTQINKQVFNRLKRLQRLNLANNQLSSLPADLFSGARDLSTLNLSNNTISLPTEGSFLNLPGLIELQCRNCSWTELHEHTFANLSSLQVLKIDLNDFNKKINTEAFRPLQNLLRVRLPELDQGNIHELCNLLKSIDNISFKHFDISCYELVLGASFNESLILVTDAPFVAPLPTNKTLPKIKPTLEAKTRKKFTATTSKQFLIMSEASSDLTKLNATKPQAPVLLAGVQTVANKSAENSHASETYQVPVSQDTINIMLISIMIIAVIGIIIGLICRKDVGGIKTKCCRSRKAEPKDQIHPVEEIPLNKMA